MSAVEMTLTVMGSMGVAVLIACIVGSVVAWVMCEKEEYGRWEKKNWPHHPENPKNKKKKEEQTEGTLREESNTNPSEHSPS